MKMGDWTWEMIFLEDAENEEAVFFWIDDSLLSGWWAQRQPWGFIFQAVMRQFQQQRE